MSDPNDKPEKQLERLLRRWGAAEAVDQARSSGQPLRMPAPAKTRPLFWRLSPLWAACLILLLGYALFVPSLSRAPEQASRSVRPKSVRMLENLQATYDALAQAEQQLTERQQKFEQETARLEAEKAELLDQTRQQAVALEQMTAQRDSFQQQLTRQKSEHQRNLADLDKNLAQARRDLEELRGRLAEANTELDQARQDHQQAVEALGQARAGLEAIQDRQLAMLSLFKEIYAGTVPDAESLAARQNAARRSHLLQRGARLRDTLASRSDRQLFDSLEVVLTRLDLMDPYNIEQRQAFAELLRPMDLIPRIEQALGREQAPEVCDWLIETQILLMGADRVG